MEKLTIDINCDLGENRGDDEQIMPFISSANIACGGHAGDKESMMSTVELARKYDVNIGAHPSYPDREGFGRRANDITNEELSRSIGSQVTELINIATEQGASVYHVKPHGSLYNRSATDIKLARLIAETIIAIDRDLVFMGMHLSSHETAARDVGLSFAGEAFADRNYDAIDRLTPRDRDDALILNPSVAAERCLDLVKYCRLRSTSGIMLELVPDTICVHGDTPGAVAIAKSVYSRLSDAGILIKGLGS